MGRGVWGLEVGVEGSGLHACAPSRKRGHTGFGVTTVNVALKLRLGFGV